MTVYMIVCLSLLISSLQYILKRPKCKDGFNVPIFSSKSQQKCSEIVAVSSYHAPSSIGRISCFLLAFALPCDTLGTFSVLVIDIVCTE
jgi:hypothetical protein